MLRDNWRRAEAQRRDTPTATETATGVVRRTESVFVPVFETSQREKKTNFGKIWQCVVIVQAQQRRRNANRGPTASSAN